MTRWWSLWVQGPGRTEELLELAFYKGEQGHGDMAGGRGEERKWDPRYGEVTSSVWVKAVLWACMVGQEVEDSLTGVWKSGMTFVNAEISASYKRK